MNTAHYLDNAATSWPKPDVVYETMDSSFRNMFSPKRGTGKASREGSSRLMQCRRTLADFFNIPEPERICFTSGCTHALNLVIQAFPWHSGDEVIISAVEHHALSRPIRKMVRERGIHLHVVPYTDEIPFDLAYLENLLSTRPNVRLIATTHASNVIGCVLPVQQIGGLARKHGVPYLLDAAQSSGVLPVDVQAMNIDFMALPAHKSLYGPPGVGAIYMGDTSHLETNLSFNTFMEGGTGGDSGVHPMSAEPPSGFEVGTIPLFLIEAFAAGVSWVQQNGLERIHQHEIALLNRLLSGLQQLPEVKIYGHQRVEEKTPVVSFNVAHYTPEEAGRILHDDYGIALRAGFHCAPMAHEAIGTLGPVGRESEGGTVRASLGYYTTEADVDAFLYAVQQLVRQQATV
ncbi:MAG: aminotransferase class V-fold PLP-dependent enzyme [Vampirovibrio sp.]|nr:aminotransferase class V-fold PLP-dependent enzyme [Vampirovibrio sp.]